MLNAKRLMSVVLILAMVVTMASFPAFADEPAKIDIVDAVSNYNPSGSNVLTKTYDGNTTGTYFQTSTAVADATNPDFYLVYDLGASYNLTHVAYYAGGTYMQGATLYGSNTGMDATDWVEIGSFSTSALNWNTYLAAQTDLNHTGYYRYIKIQSTKFNKADKPVVREVIFTGTKEPDSAPTTYTVKYVDSLGNPLAESKTVNSYAGLVVNETALGIMGYKADQITKSLELVDGTNEIVFVYKPVEKMTSTPDNLLNNATLSTTCGSFSGTAIENIIDGDLTTCWGTGGYSVAPAFSFVLDLGNNYDLNEVSFRWVLGTATANNYGFGNIGGNRPVIYTVEISSDGNTYTTAYTYNDTVRLEAVDTITASDWTVDPASVRYIRVNVQQQYRTSRCALIEMKVDGYAITDRVISVPEYLYYATGSTAVNFPITVMTLDSTAPDYFDAANWVLENCTIDSVTVEDVSDPASDYYTWNVNVKAVPDTTAEYFALDLDLPASYTLQDKLSLRREASDLLFDSAIADGDNAILLDKTTINLKYKTDGSIETTLFDRMVNATIRVQSIVEGGLPYKGYNDVVVEVTELKANGGKVRFDFEEDFVRVGDEYYGNFTFSKAGVERFEATIVLYGVNADGTKVELDKKTIFSEMINITETYPKEQTDAEKATNYTHAPDILNQLIGKVHPYDLPVISETEWDYYKAVLKARGMKDDLIETTVAKLKKMLEDELANLDDPTWVAPDYPDDLLINNNRIEKDGTYKTIIKLGAPAWNALKDLHVKSISIRGPLNHPTAEQAANESMIEDFFITFRYGIDYDYTNYLGNGFNTRMKDLGASAEYANVDLRKGYNAVRRALNDDQAMPIMFRLDWYNWPSAETPNPFSGGVITVQVTEDWINNNGMFNLATYQMSGYSYAEDNDPELTLMKDKVSVSNYINRYVSVEIEGDSAMYNSYVIVGTDKLPSELPETVGTYFDVE